jgi:hypothetical protein
MNLAALHLIFDRWSQRGQLDPCKRLDGKHNRLMSDGLYPFVGKKENASSLLS